RQHTRFDCDHHRRVDRDLSYRMAMVHPPYWTIDTKRTRERLKRSGLTEEDLEKWRLNNLLGISDRAMVNVIAAIMYGWVGVDKDMEVTRGTNSWQTPEKDRATVSGKHSLERRRDRSTVYSAGALH